LSKEFFKAILISKSSEVAKKFLKAVQFFFVHPGMNTVYIFGC